MVLTGRRVRHVRPGVFRQSEANQTITDPNGKTFSYSQDGSGNLVACTNRNGDTTTYDYGADHYLTGIHDPLGNLPLRNYYDASGRLLYSLDATGKQIVYTYNLPAGSEQVTDRNGNVTALTYDSNGNVTQKQVLGITDSQGNPLTTSAYFGDPNNPDKPTTQTDALGRVTTYTYDQSGDLLKQVFTSKDGTVSQTTTYTYDGHGHELSMQSPRHQGTTIYDTVNVYDSFGNLSTSTDALGNTTQYFFNEGATLQGPHVAPNGTLRGIIDPLGRTTSFTYDGVTGNTLTVTDAGGVTTSFAYDSNGNKTSESVVRTNEQTGLPETDVTQYQYDGDSNLTQTTYADGSATYTYYNADDKVDHTVDAGGRAVTCVYDNLGNLIHTTYQDGSLLQTLYDGNGNPVGKEDQMGRWTGTQYDAMNRVVRTGPATTTANSYPVPGTAIPTLYWFLDGTGNPIYSTTFYNDDGTVDHETDENGHTTTYGYDVLGRKTSEVDALGFTTTYSYDANGDVTSKTTPAPQGVLPSVPQTIDYKYDDNDRLIETDYPDGTFTQINYNKAGQRISQQDQNRLTTKFDYDLDGRLWRVTTPMSEVTTFGYDEIGNKITQTDAKGHTTSFAYDSMGRLVEKILPLGQTESMVYNSDGTLHTSTDYNGYTTTYGYDPNTGRLTSKTPDSRLSQPTVTWSYFADGQKDVKSRGSIVETYNYDPSRGFLTSIQEQVGSISNTVSYSYDDAGNRIAVQSPFGTTSYSYDADERMHAVLSPGATTPTIITYDGAGDKASVSRPNGVITTYNYNKLGRVTNITHSLNGTVLAAYTYQLDSAGRRTALIDSNLGTTAYDYDNDDRLISESGPNGLGSTYTNTYGYDAVGNRTSLNGQAINYDADDRNTASSYIYDPNGNVTSLNGATLTYDFENHLVSDGNESFAYDADGNRVWINNNGTVTNDVIDPTDPFVETIEERDASNGFSARYDYANDITPLDIQTANGISFLLTDGVGSVRAIASSIGSVTDSYTYDAFGDMLASANASVNNYLFNGELEDALGTYYLRARYYDPMEGRFLTQDPNGGHSAESLSLNKYIYATDSPVDTADPSGRDGIIGTLISAYYVAVDFALTNGPTIAAYVGVISTVGTIILSMIPATRDATIQAMASSPGGPADTFMGLGGGLLSIFRLAPTVGEDGAEFFAAASSADTDAASDVAEGPVSQAAHDDQKATPGYTTDPWADGQLKPGKLIVQLRNTTGINPEMGGYFGDLETFDEIGTNAIDLHAAYQIQGKIVGNDRLLWQEATIYQVPADGTPCAVSFATRNTDFGPGGPVQFFIEPAERAKLIPIRSINLVGPFSVPKK